MTSLSPSLTVCLTLSLSFSLLLRPLDPAAFTPPHYRTRSLVHSLARWLARSLGQSLNHSVIEYCRSVTHSLSRSVSPSISQSEEESESQSESESEAQKHSVQSVRQPVSLPEAFLVDVLGGCRCHPLCTRVYGVGWDLFGIAVLPPYVFAQGPASCLFVGGHIMCLSRGPTSCASVGVSHGDCRRCQLRPLCLPRGHTKVDLNPKTGSMIFE